MKGRIASRTGGRATLQRKSPAPALALALAFCLAAGTLRSEDRLYTGSISDRKSVSGGGGSYGPKFSADGRYVVFVSHANNLVTNDDRSMFLDVFRHDLQTGNTVLVSVRASGSGGGDENSHSPDISADGRYVAFASAAENLVNNDTNAQTDIFVRDVEAGVTTLVSVNSAGSRSAMNVLGNFNWRLSENPRLSADGRKVVFDSYATNLVANDTNGLRDVFWRDLDAATTRQLSVGMSFPPGAGSPLRFGAFGPSITPDANRVAFVVTATNATLGLGNPAGEVCVRDVTLGRTFWASSNAASFIFVTPPSSYFIGCTNPVISADGRHVAFVAFTTDTSSFSGPSLVYHDIDSGASTVISHQVLAPAIPAITPDGRYVVYVDISPAAPGLYLWDAQSQTKTLVSVTSNGVVHTSLSPAITADGRFVAFVSSSSGLVTNPVSSGFHVYVRDIVAGTTRIVSANPQGQGTVDHSYVVPAISTNGAVAFDSDAEDLVPEDLNRASDVFVRHPASTTNVLVSKRLASLPSATGAAFSSLSGGGLSDDGRYLLFGMTDGWEVSGDTNQFLDLFVRDLRSGTNIPISALSAGGATTNFTPRDWAISGNGRYVAYVSVTGLPPLISNPLLLRHDLLTGTDEVVTTSPGSVAGIGTLGARYPLSISADGNQIAFLGASIPSQIHVRNMAAGTNHLGSVNLDRTGGCNSACSFPVLSPDGRWLVFVSAATDLVTNSFGGGVANLIGHDLVQGTTELFSPGVFASSFQQETPVVFSANSQYAAFVNASNNVFETVDGIFIRELATRSVRSIVRDPWGAYKDFASPSLSAAGRHVAFLARSTSSVSRDAYVRNMDVGVTTLMSSNRTGSTHETTGGNRSSGSPRVSASGRYVVFYSEASNLLPQSTNKFGNIYLYDTLKHSTLLISLNTEGTAQGNSPSSQPILSADGRTLVFQSFASDLTKDDFNRAGDIFILNLGSADSDADGIDDDWEMAYFGDLFRDGSGDFDHDGVTDLREFLAGTDPTNSGSVLQVLTLTNPSGGTTTALWSAVPGKTYRLQYKISVSMPQWTDVAGDVTATGNTASKTAITLPAPQSQFFRVLLVQ